jgi:serine/threonine protein kinase
LKAVHCSDTVVRAGTQPRSLAAQAGSEPIPGYRLIAPLGSGGFGEVWKCEAPGGLLKAIKLVKGDLGPHDENSAAAWELESLQRIKAIRHPFLLSIDRIEVVSGRLLIVTELADKSLNDLLGEYQAAGRPGIPRDELLDYLAEAAEALDLMNFAHSLQHLDVKPHNLFLVSNHIKVADFGLVYSLQELSAGKSLRLQGGFTARYAPPEILQGSMSRHSDQYSLAIVYQELLTGVLPFQGKSANYVMIQKMSADPILDSLPVADRPLVARALSRNPEKRFGSCLDFVQALILGQDSTSATAELVAPSPPRPSRIRRALAGLQKERGADGPRADPEQGADAPRSPDVRTTGAPAEETQGASAAAALVVGPYRVLDLLSQDPLGETHLVQAGDGRERLARFLPGSVSFDPRVEARLVENLKTLHHPVLPPMEILHSSTGRLVLVTDLVSQTLADRFREYSAKGAPGIPREELLDYLYTAAEALDLLREEHDLQHLGLTPRTLLIEKGHLRLADFGLIELVWLAQGRSAAEINRRYGDPQLGRHGKSRSADQYSLALLYAEMLTGVHPRPVQSRGQASGVRSKGRVHRLNLDFLCGSDREVIARALDNDPARRFKSCTEFVEALDAAQAAPAQNEDTAAALLPVMPVAFLTGGSVPAGATLPSVSELVKEVLASLPSSQVNGNGSSRYPSEGLKQRFLFPTLPAAMVQLKLDGFRQEWGAELASATGDSLVYHLNAPRSAWQLFRNQQAGLAVTVGLEAAQRKETKLALATIQIRGLGGSKAQEESMLVEFGPRLLESICSYLQVRPDARASERHAFCQSIQVYSVETNLELAPVVGGTSVDLCVEGIGFQMPDPPRTDHVYLHLPGTPLLAPFLLLAQIVWVHRAEEGGYRIGAAFASKEASSSSHP